MKNSDRRSPSDASPAKPSASQVALLHPDRDRAIDPLSVKLADDPWSLTHDERLDLRALHGGVQARWLTRISGLIEPPAVDDAFPAYLLGTRPFAHLARSIGEARSRHELDTGTADELQRFVDHYRSYLIQPER